MKRILIIIGFLFLTMCVVIKVEDAEPEKIQVQIGRYASPDVLEIETKVNKIDSIR